MSLVRWEEQVEIGRKAIRLLRNLLQEMPKRIQIIDRLTRTFCKKT